MRARCSERAAGEDARITRDGGPVPGEACVSTPPGMSVGVTRACQWIRQESPLFGGAPQLL